MISKTTRRQFLGASLGSTGAALLGCAADEPTRPIGGSFDCSASPFGSGTMVGQVPFANEDDVTLNTPLGSGLDGRLYTDLTQVDTERRIIENEHFYIRTRTPDLIDRDNGWSIAIHGLVEARRTVNIAEIENAARSMGVHLLECSGNARGAHFGLMSAAEWSGVRLSDLLGEWRLLESASRIRIAGFDEHSMPSVGGHSTPGASWVFSLADIRDADAFLATGMNGQALPSDHGAPVRLFAPGWYGCACIKWVNEIALVADDEPATSQMVEFASRTHQTAAHELARDYRPALMQPAAMPVRVETWRVSGRIVHRVIGILWGNTTTIEGLEIRFGNGDWQPVAICEPRQDTRTWTLWEHPWWAEAEGIHAIVLRFRGGSVRSVRLDEEYYLREVRIRLSGSS